MQFLLLFSLNTLFSFFQFDGWRGDIQQPQAKQEALCVGVKVKIKAFLEGPYALNAARSVYEMTPSLAASIPTTQPYSTAPYMYDAATNVNGFKYYSAGTVIAGGGEISTTAILTGTNGTNINGNAIVDWVFVELRDPANTANVLETRAALLQADGDVVDTDGMLELTFATVNCGSFFVALHHRNHLAVKTATTVALTNDANTTAVVDFSASTTVITGVVDCRALITLTGGATNGGRALASGDTDHSNAIESPDRDNTWNGRNLSGYQRYDCSMNGTVDGPDRDKTWNNRNKTNL
jgi:hypothetical protein